MKLKAYEAKSFFNAPDATKAGVLIYGPDPMLVAHGCEKVVTGLRRKDCSVQVERVPTDGLTRNPESIASLLKAQGFFAERRIICLENVNDSITESVSLALETHTENDSWLVVTAGLLRPASKLRKLFEASAKAVSAPIFDAAMTRGDVEAALAKAGLKRVGADGLDDLLTLARGVPPQIFGQTLEKLALLKAHDDSPVISADIEDCVPPFEDGTLDDLMKVLMERRHAGVGPALRQVIGNGQSAVTIVLRAQREFRNLLLVSSDPQGAHRGVAKVRPAAFGPRRDWLLRRAEEWGESGAESALGYLVELDRQLRSVSKVPAIASLERVLMRLTYIRRADA